MMDDHLKFKANKLCGICGDKALGYNFNAITCEACKAFFRRNALRKKEFKCPFEGNCKIDLVTRRFCQKCRLKKCFDIGMKKEWILSEDEKKIKRDKILENRRKKELSSLSSFTTTTTTATNASPSSSSCSSSIYNEHNSEMIISLTSQNIGGNYLDKNFINNTINNNDDNDNGNDNNNANNNNNNINEHLMNIPATIQPQQQQQNHQQNLSIDFHRHYFYQNHHYHQHYHHHRNNQKENFFNSLYLLEHHHHQNQKYQQNLISSKFFSKTQNNNNDSTGQQSFSDIKYFDQINHYNQQHVYTTQSLNSSYNHYQQVHQNEKHPLNHNLTCIEKSTNNLTTTTMTINNKRSPPVPTSINNLELNNNIKTEYNDDNIHLIEINTSIKNEPDDYDDDRHCLNRNKSCLYSSDESESTVLTVSNSIDDVVENYKISDSESQIKNKASPSSSSNNQNNSNISCSSPEEKSKFNQDNDVSSLNNNNEQQSNDFKTRGISVFQLNINVSAPDTLSESYNYIENNLLEELTDACQHLHCWYYYGSIGLYEIRKSNEIYNVADHIIRHLISMAKMITSFNELCKTDQISLLKYSIIEILMLRSVLCYFPDKEAWIFNLNNNGKGTILQYNTCITELLSSLSLSLSSSSSSSIEFILNNDLKHFIISVPEICRNDRLLFDLATMIILFNPNCTELKHKDVVRLEYLTYCHLLCKYIHINYSSSSKITSSSLTTNKIEFGTMLNIIDNLHRINQKIITTNNNNYYSFSIIIDEFNNKYQNDA